MHRNYGNLVKIFLSFCEILLSWLFTIARGSVRNSVKFDRLRNRANWTDFDPKELDQNWSNCLWNRPLNNLFWKFKCVRVLFKAWYINARARNMIFEVKNEFAIVENIYLDTSHFFFMKNLRTDFRISLHTSHQKNSYKVGECIFFFSKKKIKSLWSKLRDI